jgi:hypothetical protein
MSLRLNVRNFTGTTIPLDVDPTQTIEELKKLLTSSGKGKSVRIPALSHKGHELRDARQIQHYDIASKDMIHIRELESALENVCLVLTTLNQCHLLK